MMIYLTAFWLAALSAFFKGFQHKNVLHSMYWWVAATSAAIGVGDAFMVKMVYDNHWSLGLCTGLGAALGMVAAIYVHGRFVMPRKEVVG
jgi:hypothetical protein